MIASASNNEAGGAAARIEQWFKQFDGSESEMRQRVAAHSHQVAINMAFGIGADEWRVETNPQTADTAQTLCRTAAWAAGVLLALLIGIQAALAFYETWTDGNRSPRSLGGDFISRTSMGAVRAELLAKGYKPSVATHGVDARLFDKSSDPGDVSLVVERYRFNAYLGTLTLQFFNAQLMSVSFNADDVTATSGGTRRIGCKPCVWQDKAFAAESVAESVAAEASAQ